MKLFEPLGRLLKLLDRHKKELTSIYFYAILSGIVQLSVPIGVQAIIGFVLGATMVTSIYVLIVLVVIGVLLVGVMQMNQMKIIEKIQQSIFASYAIEFTEVIPRFDLRKTDDLYLPEHVNKFFDVLNVQKGLSKILLEIPIASIQILFGLILLSLYHPVFIVFGLLLLVVLIFILKYTSVKGLETSLKESSYKYSVVAWLQEMARVIKSFKFSQGSHLNLQKTDKNLQGYLTARTAHFKILLFQYQTLVFFKVTITSAMLIIGTFLLINQSLNIGEFIAAEIVILMVIASIEKLISSLDSVYDVITGLEKLATVTDSPQEKDGSVLLNAQENGVEFDMVDFSYNFPNGQLLFNKVNLSIPKYSLVGISGLEGAGKSTLLKIFSGSVSDYQGNILLNNIPMTNYQLESLRNQIGMYLHQQDIFKGSIFENISMCRQGISPEIIMETAETLGFEKFLINIHNGLDTLIDASGKKLPNTLVKKLLLLRAFVNKPILLLLDEPWTGLEEQAKNNLIDYLLDKKLKRTILVATNDADFLSKCDIQIELNNGNAIVK